MKFTLHDMTPKEGVNAIEDMLDSYCNGNCYSPCDSRNDAAAYKKYLTFLRQLKKLVDECAEGHGISE